MGPRPLVTETWSVEERAAARLLALVRGTSVLNSFHNPANSGLGSLTDGGGHATDGITPVVAILYGCPLLVAEVLHDRKGGVR